MDIEFKILGPPELRATGRDRVTLSPQLWCVLVSLLLAQATPVPAEILIERLWSEKPPRKASATIRSYVWRIDRALSQALGDGTHVSRRAHGYAIEVDPHSLDLNRFRSLKRQADALAESGETQQATRMLREAGALWHGRALSGLPGDWIGRLRESLEEERRAAVFRRIELELDLGRHAALIAELAELSDEHPLNEDLAAHRMKALFRAGRQSDALRVYRQTRTRLAAEGIKPNPELAELHQRILRHDPELAITPAYRSPSRQPQPDTLPPDITDFIGRVDEMRALTEPADQPALWVIEGMGGVGKTALAVHAAHQMSHHYPDARLFLNFRAHDPHRQPLDPADALRELLVMLEVPAVRIPRSLRARGDLWRGELAGRRVVLVFDDVASPDQIKPLLPTTGGSSIIVTSRQRHAGWGTGRPLLLHVFSESDAASLFTRISGQATNGGPDQAATVCRLCGCLPLAIRLAASRVRSGAVDSMSDLIDELGEPTDDHSPHNEVSQRVEASFELSYRRLAADQQSFFRCLGTSPCLDITASSAAALTGTTLGESRIALSVLTDHHLLAESTPGRFGFHDLIRAFAVARCSDEDPPRLLRQAVSQLADFYLHAVSRADQVRRKHHLGSEANEDERLRQLKPFADVPAEAKAWLESEWPNALRVAEQCARHEFKDRCAQLVHALAQYLETNGHWDDALNAHLMALQACRDLADHAGIARSSFDLSVIYVRIGRNEEALRHATEAADIFAMLGDSRGKAAALDRIGIIHRNTARFRDSLAYHQEALDLYRAAGDSRGLARGLVNAGAALWYLGRLREEMNYLSQALEIYRAEGDLHGQAAALNNMGTVQQHRGYHRDAMRSYQASHDLCVETGERQNLALADHNMARVQQYKGNYRTAVTSYRAVLATYRLLGDPRHQAYALADIGSVYRSTERFDEALAHYEKASAMAEKAGDRYAYAEALCGIAEAHFGSGRTNAAMAAYEQTAKLAGEIESLYLKAKALNGIAEIALHTRGQEAARIYWREALDIFAQIGVPEAAAVEIRLHSLDVPAS